MELKKIQYFLSIVEEGSLSKAAQSLYLTQPTLSRFLARLEEEAGVQLFRRNKDSSLELTEAGEAYLNAAKKINKIWQSLEADFSALKESESEHICVAIDNDGLHTFVRSCADVIIKKYPNVTLETHCLNSGEIQRGVLEGKIDIGYTSYYQFKDELSYKHIEENEINLVVSKNNSLAKKYCQIAGQKNVRISINELPKSTPFLLMREGHVLRQCIDGYMETQNVTPYVPTTYFRLDYIGKILSGDDTLVGFCPNNHIFKELCYIALDPPLYHKRGLCYRKGRKLTEAQKLLVGMMSEFPKKWGRE